MKDSDPLKLVQAASEGDRDAIQRLILHHHSALHAKVVSAMDPTLARRLDADDVLQQAYVSAFRAVRDAGPPSPASRRNAERPNPASSRSTGPPSPASDRDTQRPESPRAETGKRQPGGHGSSANTPHFDSPAGFYKWLEQIALNELRNRQRDLLRQKRDIRREIHGSGDTRTSYPDLMQRLAASDDTPSRHLAQAEATAAVLSSLARLTEDQRAVVRLRFLEGRSVAETAAALGKSHEAVHALCYRALKELRGLLESVSRYLTRR